MPTFSHYYEMKIRIRIIMHHLKCNVIQMVIQILCYNNFINIIIVSKPKLSQDTNYHFKRFLIVKYI